MSFGRVSLGISASSLFFKVIETLGVLDEVGLFFFLYVEVLPN